MNPAEFCRDAAAPPGSNFHYAALFHTAEERRALCALFALRAEILRIAAGTPDAAVAAMRRSWWVDELARVAARQARHPIGIELQRLADRMEIEIPALQHFAAAGGTVPATPDANGMRGAAAAAWGIWGAAARVCDVTQTTAVDAAIRAGALVDAVDSLASGHPPVADPGAVAACLVEFDRHLDSARRDLDKSGAGRAEFCRIMAGLSAALCAEMRREVRAVGQVRVALTPLRKLWIAWRIHRRRAAA